MWVTVAHESTTISDYSSSVRQRYSTTAKGPATEVGVSYQLGQASSGEDPARTVQVKVSRTPAPHVEPFHSSGRERPILLMEQDELLLGSDRGVLQHPLQLQQVITPREWGRQVFPASVQFNRILDCEIQIYMYTPLYTSDPYSHLNLQTARILKRDWFRQLQCCWGCIQRTQTRQGFKPKNECFLRKPSTIKCTAQTHAICAQRLHQVILMPTNVLFFRFQSDIFSLLHSSFFVVSGSWRCLAFTVLPASHVQPRRTQRTLQMSQVQVLWRSGSILHSPKNLTFDLIFRFLIKFMCLVKEHW